MKKLIHTLCALVMVFGMSGSIYAADTETSIDATITWLPNSEADLAGYKVYRSLVSGEYGAPIATLPKTQTTFTIAIPRGATDVRNYFTVTAFDTEDPAPALESPKSAEVSKLIAAVAVIPKPGTPVLTVTSDNPGELTVTWPDVPDGRGGKAKVNIRFAVPPIQWGSATSAPCDSSPCKIVGLNPATMYEVKGVGIRVDGTTNIYGTISNGVQQMTDPIIDIPPTAPQGIIISSADKDEVVLVASAEDCKEMTVSALGTSDLTHKLKAKCVK